MAFLTLDGNTINAAKGGESSPSITGSASTDFDGAYIRNRIAYRHKWSFETITQSRMTHQALVNQILGRGQQWHYDSHLRSTKSLSPETTAVATIITGQDQQTPPADVYLESTGEKQAYFGSGALEMETSTTNFFPADVRDAENAPTGYTVLNGSTLTGETTIVLQGSKSLKCTTGPLIFSGLYVDVNSGYTAGNDVTASVSVYTTEALPLELELYDGFTNISKTWTSTANAWERVEITNSTNVGSTSLRFRVMHAQAAASKVFYCDEFQIEEQSAATPWADGSRADEELVYKGIAGLSDNLTFCAWVRGRAANPSGLTRFLLDVSDSGRSNYVSLTRSPGNNEIRIIYAQDGDSGSKIITSVWDDAWHHIAFRISTKDDTTDTNEYNIFVDGVSEESGTLSTSEYPYLKDTAVNVSIGAHPTDSGRYWEGPMCEVFLVPYAMSDSQITALASRTRQTPGLPKVDAGGDFNFHAVSGENYPVLGSVSSVKYDNCGDPDAPFRGRVSFALKGVDEI
jgi:hypothetical protein